MASVTHYNFEGSSGPTSRTTTGQFSNMNGSDRVKKLMADLSDSIIQLEEKEEEIRRLKEHNESLKEENDKLRQQQFKVPDQYTPNRHIDVTRKVTELKKVVDDFLEYSNRPQRPPYQSVPTLNPIAFSDINKSSTSTSENSKPFRSGLDESATNGTNHIDSGNHTGYNNNQDDFSSSRLGSDQEIITQATDIRPQMPSYYNGHTNNFVPATARRFQQNGLGGMSNNNNNNNRNRNNNNNNNSKYTIFIAWTGSVSSADQLRELFDPNDVADIRYTPPKQFAHVDLRTESAMKKAMSLDQTTKNETQGLLRVETGKPRSSNNNNNNNNTENGQRLQNQNKNYRQNNKNPNYNNNSLQKHNNNKYNNNHIRNNNSHSQYPNFVLPEEKENGTNCTNGTNGINSSPVNAWNNYAANSSSNPQEPKSTGESH